MELFYKVLEKLREKKGLTQKELASKLGMARTTYSGYATGTREPDLETLQKIAAYFEVSTDYLLGVDGKEVEEQNKTNFIIDGLVKKYNLDLSIEGEREKLEQFIKLYADLRNS